MTEELKEYYESSIEALMERVATRVYDQRKEDEDKKHKEIMDSIKKLSSNQQPFLDIMDYLEKSGKITLWIGKYICIPIVVLLGALVSIKKLHG